MNVTVRPYEPSSDYDRVGEFLLRTWSDRGTHANWPQMRWEYMHHHPLIERVELRSIGVWEQAGEIVGVVHPEHSMGLAYFQVAPGHEALKVEMLAHAEQHIRAQHEGQRRLLIFVDDRDTTFQRLAADRGYSRSEWGEPMSCLEISSGVRPGPLPEGFRLQSLADDNDLRKVDRVLWRGFGHGDDPPEEGIRDREFMQSAPNFRHDLNVVVQAPNGDFAAYCGMWYEPRHAAAYVEPVATDPSYRRMGLGKAAVQEGIRRCGEQGARVAWVGSDLPIYLSIGFQVSYSQTAWQRSWTT